MKRPNARVLTRYLLLQIPSWILLGSFLLALHEWRGLSGWIVAAVLGAWVFKDLALYPLVKNAYDPSRACTPEQMLVGQRGTAEQDLAPDGYVRVRGELWRATSVGGCPPVRRGERVLVREVHRMRLLIEPEPGPADAVDAGGVAQKQEGPAPSGGRAHQAHVGSVTSGTRRPPSRTAD